MHMHMHGCMHLCMSVCMHVCMYLFARLQPSKPQTALVIGFSATNLCWCKGKARAAETSCESFSGSSNFHKGCYHYEHHHREREMTEPELRLKPRTVRKGLRSFRLPEPMAEAD